MEEEVVIFGDGIAGLATAVALKQIGVRSLVLERSDKIRATGAALSLFSNAWLALDALGDLSQTLKLEQCKKLYIPKKDGKSIGFRTVHRSALLKALAEELPGDTIRFSSKLNSIETVKCEGMSFVLLRLEDGTIIRAKAVIGCDGVHSIVRQWLGLKPLMDSGRSVVRGLTVYPQGHGLKHEFSQFLDSNSKSGFIPLNDKELYWFISYKSTDANMNTKDPESKQKNILENTAHFPKVYLDVVRHTDLNTISWAPLVFRVPWELLYKNLSEGNVTVAGDAMHPTMPDLGQGGCAALEDVVILGRHIGNSLVRNGKIVPEAVQGYVKERRWHVAGEIAASFLSGWMQQEISSWFIKFIRDKVFFMFFYYYVASIINYDCGKLPHVPFSIKAENMKNIKIDT